MVSRENNYHHIAVDGDVVHVLQLTDTHLCAKQGGKLLGMDTDHSLCAVIDLALQQHPAVDVVLGTGDLADNGAPDAYRRLDNYFSRFDCDSFWLPGNHDDRAAMAASNGGSRLTGQIRAGQWQVLLLNSQIPGEVGGGLGEAELASLESALQEAAAANLHSLLVMHHHPVLIDCEWLDEQIVADADAFFAIVDRYPGVRAVLWGHVHQEIDRMRADVRLLATPSTCVQFLPGSKGFAADAAPPGYRSLKLHADGSIETAVARVEDVQFTVDLDSGGY